MSTTQHTEVAERLVHKKELLERTGRSYSHICQLMKQGKFPKPRDFNGRPAWRNSDINAWINNMPERLVRGDPGAGEAYEKQRVLAAKSVESKRRAAAEKRRENVQKRKIV